jgi:hypothetical protein
MFSATLFLFNVTALAVLHVLLMLRREALRYETS